MEYIIYYLDKLFPFILSLFLLLVTIYIFIKYILFKIKKGNINIKTFGLFSGLSDKDILMFSVITLRYIFFIWCLFKTDYTFILEDYHFYFLLIADILFDIINNKIISIPFSVFNNVIIYFALMMNATLFNYINTISLKPYIILIMALVLLFIFSYVSYFYIKDILIILKRNKYIKKKEKMKYD